MIEKGKKILKKISEKKIVHTNTLHLVVPCKQICVHVSNIQLKLAELVYNQKKIITKLTLIQ